MSDPRSIDEIYDEGVMRYAIKTTGLSRRGKVPTGTRSATELNKRTFAEPQGLPDSLNDMVFKSAIRRFNVNKYTARERMLNK